MISINIQPFDDIIFGGDIELSVHRKFSWFGKIRLDFEMAQKKILELSNSPLGNYGIKVHSQALGHAIALQHNDKKLYWEGNTVELKTSRLYFIRKRYATLLYNGFEAGEVIFKKRFGSIKLEVQHTLTDTVAILYSSILIAMDIANLDGAQ